MEAKAYLPGMAIRCLEYVETWVSEEGLYRVSGSHHQVQQLKTLFDAGCDLDLRNISTAELDPHSVTGLFKLWLRECKPVQKHNVLWRMLTFLLNSTTRPVLARSRIDAGWAADARARPTSHSKAQSCFWTDLRGAETISTLDGRESQSRSRR